MATGVFGREAELGAVDAVLAAARQGLAALVLEGDPGIGKTTVWQQGIAHAVAGGYRVLSCRAAPTEVRQSFAALGDLLAPVERPAFDSLPHPQRAGCCPSGRDCCNGTCRPDGQFCSNGSCACLGVRSPCDPANNQCCQGEPTSCLDTTPGQFADRCCRPKGGNCSGNLDCCRNIFINTNLGYCSAGVCGGDGAACSFHQDCVGGFCYGHCNNVAPVRDCFSDEDCPPGGLCIEKECTNCPAFSRRCGNECCFLGQCCGDHCCP